MDIDFKNDLHMLSFILKKSPYDVEKLYIECLSALEKPEKQTSFFDLFNVLNPIFYKNLCQNSIIDVKSRLLFLKSACELSLSEFRSSAISDIKIAGGKYFDLRKTYDFNDFSDLSDGCGRPILVLPGVTCNSILMKPLENFLSDLNYEVFSWGSELNIPDNYDILNSFSKLNSLKKDVLKKSKYDSLGIIGHSLGGVFGRVLKCYYPSDISSLITLGSPEIIDEITFVNGFLNSKTSRNTKIINLVSGRNSDRHCLEKRIYTSKCSESFGDGFVGDNSCNFYENLDLYNVEYCRIPRESHCSLIFSKPVFREIGETLEKIYEGNK